MEFRVLRLRLSALAMAISSGTTGMLLRLRLRAGVPRFAARARDGVLLGLLLAALATAGGASATANGSVVRAAQNSGLGTEILVDSSGFTLYHLTTERKGSIGCSGACRKLWPPLLVVGSAKPVAGAGLSASRLGTMKRPDGGVQLTYNGFALYLFSGDKTAGQTKGQGLGGTWYAITAAGAVTKANRRPNDGRRPAVDGIAASDNHAEGGASID